MSRTRCIIRQDWTERDAESNLIERHTGVYVTNEDGTPHVYDSIKEARAEIIANYGRDANKSGILHTHSVGDYTGNVHDGYVCIIREDSEEYAEAIAQAEEAAERAAVEAAATPEAYAEAMGSCEDAVNLISYGAYEALHDGTHPETAAEVHELDSLMGYAAEIVQRDGAARGIQWEEYRVCVEDAREAWTGPDYYRIAYSDGGMDATNDGAIWYETAEDLAQDLASAYQSATETHLPYAERYERERYERHELEAYLGEPDDYDVDAIEAEATEYDPRTGARVWTASDAELMEICERHDRTRPREWHMTVSVFSGNRCVSAGYVI